MNQSTPSPASRLHNSARAALAAACVLALAACNMPQQADDPIQPTLGAPGPTSAPPPTEVMAQPVAVVTPTAQLDAIDAELGQYGVSVPSSQPIDTSQRQAVLDAVRALAAAVASIDPQGVAAPTQKFGDVYGHTVIRIYPDRVLVDGVHVALNCGWEGRFAAGCKAAEIYPEQDFPQGSWLILIGGAYLASSSPDENVGLIAHEIVHNLTWGGGHLHDNVNGYSYVWYVGDEFAIEYMDYLGVSAGRDTYVDEAAREANERWRAELTADAIASWALGKVNGPDAKMVNGYIQGLMACKVYGIGRCY